MSAVALGLLLLAAGLHAGWNVLVKRAADRQATLWWGLVIAGAVLIPALALAWPPPWEAVAFSLASSIFEALYFLALVAAYGVGDLSLVYPVARGSAPLLIALGAVLLLGERPSLGGWVGICLAVSGVVLLSAPGQAAVPAPGQNRPGLAVLLALATGLCISAYSLINKLGLSYLFAPAFTCLFHLGTALLLAPYLVRTRGRKLLEPWRREPWKTALVGIMVGCASTLVLAALAIERASYVGAVREVSVILGALAGWLLLGEPLGQRRTLAAAVMFAGLALIASLG